MRTRRSNTAVKSNRNSSVDYYYFGGLKFVNNGRIEGHRVLRAHKVLKMSATIKKIIRIIFVKRFLSLYFRLTLFSCLINLLM